MSSTPSISVSKNVRSPLPRADLNRNFVLRGAISCTDCGNSLTACWSKGRKKRYAYYLCHTRGCESFGKSIARDKLEDEFEVLVKSLRPSPQLVDIAMDMFKTAWNQIASKVDKEDQLTARSIKAIDDDIDKLVDRMLETESDRVVAAFEKKIAKLEEKKAIIDARQGSKVKKRGHFDDTVRTAQMSQPFQLIEGLRESKTYKNALECVMVGLSDQTSNLIWDELEDWDRTLAGMRLRNSLCS